MLSTMRSLQSWRVYTHGGRNATDWEVIDWSSEAVKRGAGEILLTSMDKDGEKSGFDLALTKAVSQAVSVLLLLLGAQEMVKILSMRLKKEKLTRLWRLRSFTIKRNICKRN